MAYIFSWIPAYQSIAQQLLGYRNRQGELIQLLRQIGVDVMDDEDSPGNKIPLSEIDPFTFICHLNKYGDLKRKQLLRNLCAEWTIPVVINDVNGIPSANAQRLWLFPFQYSRNNNEINRLWDFYEHFMSDSLSDELFSDVLKIRNVGIQKITEVMFTFNPSQYLCLNSVVKPYLNEVHKIETDFTTYTELQSLQTQIRLKVGQPFHIISYEGYLHKAFKDLPVNYFRIGSTEGSTGKSILPEMIIDNVISVGWWDIGDLEKLNPINKSTIQRALQESGYKANDNKVASRKAGEILTFYEKIKPLDIAVVVEGQQVKAIGRVYTSNYVFNEANEFPHSKVVEWLDTQIADLKITEGLNTSVVKLGYPETIQIIQDYLQKKKLLTPQKTKPSMETNYLTSMNAILFGPPGTGKTFNSINHAIAIIENKSIDEINTVNRSEVKARFDNYLKEGRVVFTTFHQSMSYEDFIEGIKPETIEEQVTYEVQDGIFKRLCLDASFSIAQEVKSTETMKALDFSNLYDQFVDSLETTLSQPNTSASAPTKSGGSIQIEGISPQGNIIVKHVDGSRTYTISKQRLTVLDQNIDDLDDVNNINSRFREIIGGSNSSAYWAILRAIRSMKPSINNSKKEQYSQEDKISAISTLQESDYKNVSGKPYVIIIDEINRGNIAQIFGELITLIEEDKRRGRKEALQVTLPYSKKKFGVPPNVYIIGTMNTADRSVEALDTALRRRFSFTEIPPKSKLIATHGKLKDKRGTIEGIVLTELLETINKRIEKLLDKDHLIGHSYFMDVASLQDLKQAFQNKINPLLQEYFYGDFGKIGLVIGQLFFEQDSLTSKGDDQIFTDFPEYEVSDLLDRKTYRLANIAKMSDEEFIAAINKLLRK